MKHIRHSLFILHSSFFILPLHALPRSWDVDLDAQSPQVFTLQRPRGETYELEAVLKLRGKPFEPAITNACIYWQTNGMENLYWSAPASVSNNVLRATWLPSMDPGATTVRGYIGDPGKIYAAAFQFRFIASPGATPNALPLPVPVIDFAKVRVLNPPWSGGGGGVNTNAVRDIIHATVDGAARPLPKYLHLYEANDSYTNEAAAYYRSRGDGKTDGGCSSVRDGGFLYRNFDFPFDDRAEFIVRMSAGTVPPPFSAAGASQHRFASVGVAQVGTNLTEQMVTSGKPEYSRLYKWLPGATVDGINENGVACNINVVDGDPQTSGWHNDTGDLHPLAAIRWMLDHATNAQYAAEYIASHIAFPQGWAQNFHYMVADEEKTYIVEDGRIAEVRVIHGAMTNFKCITPNMEYDPYYGSGPGEERLFKLYVGANITNVWYTNAYRRETNPPWVSDLAEVIDYTNDIFNAWAAHPKEYFRGKTNNGIPWWQSVHTSIYDLTNRTLRVSVQEVDDWYTFQVPSAGGTGAKIDAYTKGETDAKLAGKVDVCEGLFFGMLDDLLYGFGFTGTYNRWCDDGFSAGAGAVWFPNTPSEGDPCYLDGVKTIVNGEPRDIAARPTDFDPYNTGNLAALDANGNLADSGILMTINDYGALEYGGNFVVSSLDASGAIVGREVIAIDINGQTHDLSAKADRSMIHHTNPTFSNEVATVARTVQPTSIRAYDRVRKCWWVLEMVNGVPTWTVED